MLAQCGPCVTLTPCRSSRQKHRISFAPSSEPRPDRRDSQPPQFDPSKFPVPGGITVPLASFGEGSYRLNVKITDKANSNKVLSQDIKFTVKG